MADPPGPRSVLYHRLRLLQRVFPLVASIPIVLYELLEHAILTRPIALQPFLLDVLLYGVISPTLMLVLLTWLLRRLAERDEAEARLSALYEVSRQSTSASDVEELEELALILPEKAGLVGAHTLLLVQDAPGGPLLLAGTRGFGAPEVGSLKAGLAGGELQPGCAQCQQGAATWQEDCRLLGTIRGGAAEAPGAALCLMLSRDPARQVVLSVFHPGDADELARVTETLVSMAGGLAVALDRARLQARERQLLQQVERAVRTEQLGLVPTLQRILADIAAQQSIAAGAVFLLRRNEGEPSLAAVASWPTPGAGAMLAQSALTAVQPSMNALLRAGAETVALGWSGLGPSATPPASEPGQGVAAVPITSEGEALGVLVIAYPAERADGAAVRPSEKRVLEVVTSMMALLIRNSLLYTQLESRAVLDERSRLAAEVHDGIAQSLAFLNVKVQQVQRLLTRGQVDEAAAALQELREGGQEAYTEVRLLIQGLRWSVGAETGLTRALQEYGAAVAMRTGLVVTVDGPGESNLPPEIQIQLFRIVQEALSNVRQHAQARHVMVRLTESADCMALTVEDDGTGLPASDPEGDDHFGLRIMRERVQSVGGELELESRAGAGTTLHVLVPVGAAAVGHMEEPWSASVS
jgi:nitrate/nitrite-specific signal transduction histidine kinase